MAISRKLDYVILDMIESSQRTFKAAPMNLGGIPGSGGGIGGPPGGFIGWLPQRRVAYDTDELATLDTAVSGSSILDNLNHIRYRIGVLESGVAASLTVVDDNFALPYYDVGTIHFSGAGITVTDLGSGDIRVSVEATGSGGGGVEEAPIDGSTYGRKNGTWAIVSGGSGRYRQYVYATNVRSDHAITQSFNAEGVLAAVSGAMGAYIVAVESGVLDSVYMYMDYTGTAGVTIVDVNINGVTAFTDQANRPKVYYDGLTKKNEAFPSISGLVKGDIITFDIDTVASGAAGLTVAPIITPMLGFGFVTSAGEPVTVLLDLE